MFGTTAPKGALRRIAAASITETRCGMTVERVETEIWSIDKIRPYGRNLRRNDHAVDRMVAAIREFGFRIPVLVRSDGELIDGHLRLKAARKLGLTELPVILCDDWTPAQVKAFRLLVNRSTSWAEWDLEHVAFGTR